MTPRIRGDWPKRLLLGVWISKLLSYTMLPTHARAGFPPVVSRPSVARRPHGGCILPPQAWGCPDVARQQPNCGAAPAIQGPAASVLITKCAWGMCLSISTRSARVLRSSLEPATPRRPSTWFSTWQLETRPPTRPSYWSRTTRSGPPDRWRASWVPTASRSFEPIPGSRRSSAREPHTRI